MLIGMTFSGQIVNYLKSQLNAFLIFFHFKTFIFIEFRKCVGLCISYFRKEKKINSLGKQALSKRFITLF